MLLNAAEFPTTFFYCYTLCDLIIIGTLLGVVYAPINVVLLNVVATSVVVGFATSGLS